MYTNICQIRIHKFQILLREDPRELWYTIPYLLVKSTLSHLMFEDWKMCRCCTFDLYSSVGSEIEFDLNDIKETTYNQKVKYLRETYLQVLQTLWFESYVSVCYWMRGWKKNIRLCGFVRKVVTLGTDHSEILPLPVNFLALWKEAPMSVTWLMFYV